MSRSGRPSLVTLVGNPDLRLLVESLMRNTEIQVAHGNPASPPAETLRLHSPDLALVQMDMSGVSGLELVCRIRRDPLYSDLVIVGVGTEDGPVPPQVALMAGCSGFIPYPFHVATFADQIAIFLAGEKQSVPEGESLRIHRLFSEALIEELEDRLADLEKKHVALLEERERQNALTLQVLTSLAALLDAKDSYTHGHSSRVTHLSLILGKRVGLQGEDLKTLERSALLHDIGKIAVDLAHIHKPGPLSSEEWEKVKEHSEIGFRILAHLDFLGDEAHVVRHHHRRFEDYTPDQGISPRVRKLASILTLVDSFDAMTTRRAYNQPKDLAAAKAEIARCSGSHFDPALAEAFIGVLADEDTAAALLPASSTMAAK